MDQETSPWIDAVSASEVESRRQAVEHLTAGNGVTRRAAMALINAVGDEDELIREAANEALESLGIPRVSDAPTLERLLASANPDIGYWAATLLGRIGPAAEHAVDALSKAVSQSPHRTVRHRAAWALGRFGPAAQPAVNVLEQASQDGDARLARLARQALQAVEP